jgi:isoamylase
MEAVVDREAAREQAVEEYGLSYPLGATVVPGGANSSVYSRDASRVELLLFDRQDDSRPSRVIPLDPALNRTYHYWHTFVPGVSAGQIYGYRVNRPWDRTNGMRFDPTKSASRSLRARCGRSEGL